MILGLSLGHFLLIWLSNIAVIVIIVLLPFMVRWLRPQSYHGFWQIAGDAFLKSPKRALMYPLGMLLGLGFVVAVFYERELTIEDAQTLLIVALWMFVVFMGIVLGWRLYLLERDRDR
jgi:hypothetical protein